MVELNLFIPNTAEEMPFCSHVTCPGHHPWKPGPLETGPWCLVPGAAALKLQFLPRIKTDSSWPFDLYTCLMRKRRVKTPKLLIWSRLRFTSMASLRANHQCSPREADAAPSLECEGSRWFLTSGVHISLVVALPKTELGSPTFHFFPGPQRHQYLVFTKIRSVVKNTQKRTPGGGSVG